MVCQERPLCTRLRRHALFGQLAPRAFVRRLPVWEETRAPEVAHLQPVSFRIPKHKLGIDVTGAQSGLVQYDQGYLNDTLSSYCERWIPKLEELGDVDGDELFVEFDYEHFLKADIATRLGAKKAGVMGMIYTPNEVRRSEGLPDVEGGDVVYQQQNLVPLGTPPQPKVGASDPNGKPPSGDSPSPNE